MVMDEDEAVRINRLTMLSQLRELFLKVLGYFCFTIVEIQKHKTGIESNAGF